MPSMALIAEDECANVQLLGTEMYANAAHEFSHELFLENEFLDDEDDEPQVEGTVSQWQHESGFWTRK